jgi:hypothetical protein
MESGAVVIRPLNHIVSGKILGHYRRNLKTGGTTGLAADAPITSFRWTDPNSYAVLLSVMASASISTAFTASQLVDLEVFRATGFIVADSGGTSSTPFGSNQKNRTSNMGPSLLNDLRVATNAALTAGTRTLDTAGFGHAVFYHNNAAGNADGPREAYAWRTFGQHPIVFAVNEGFICTVPTAQGATGVVKYYITVEWAEVSLF